MINGANAKANAKSVNEIIFVNGPLCHCFLAMKLTDRGGGGGGGECPFYRPILFFMNLKMVVEKNWRKK